MRMLQILSAYFILVLIILLLVDGWRTIKGALPDGGKVMVFSELKIRQMLNKVSRA